MGSVSKSNILKEAATCIVRKNKKDVNSVYKLTVSYIYFIKQQNYEVQISFSATCFHP